MTSIKIEKGKIYNVSITYEDFQYKCMRLEFDIATPIGEFHFDSDTQPVNMIHDLLLKFGLLDVATHGIVPSLDIDITVYSGGGDH